MSLVRRLGWNSHHPGKTNIQVVHCGVTSYSDNLAVFDTAYQTCGRIDHAIAITGLGEQGSSINLGMSLELIIEKLAKSMQVIDINLRGPLYFARLTSVDLRQPGPNDKSSTEAADKSLSLMARVGGFREDPGLYVYMPSKHGVLDIMRSFRTARSQSEPNRIRINAVCLWITRARLVAGLERGLE